MQEVGDVGVDTLHQIGSALHAGAQADQDLLLPQGAVGQVRLDLLARVVNRRAVGGVDDSEVEFEDPDKRCTGCSHCIANCPEGIIRWQPDPERGVLVTGADVGSFCKLCAECIAVCPEELFKEGRYEEVWEEATP